jgi:hypothetical protein
MKKRYHVEITSFRRRTTIVLRDSAKAGGRLRSEGVDEPLAQKHAELLQASRSLPLAPNQIKERLR